jgi:hypothetical protein
MNKSLTYAKSPMKGFVNNDDWMENHLVPFDTTSTMSRDDVYAIANKNRDNCSPVFADDSKYLPTNVVAGDAGAVVVSTPLPTPMNVTMPTSSATTIDTSKPNKELVNGILIGVGVIILFKILA